MVLKYSATGFTPQSYGHWRRIDDFVVDALLCWPELGYIRLASGVEVVGRWKEGRWSPTSRRRFSVGNRINDEDASKCPVAEPVILPLDLPSPLLWEYVDEKRPEAKATLCFERLPETHVPYLPRSSKVTGFQGKVPYLKRSDEKAFIFFSELQPFTHRGEEPTTNLFYTYVDEDVFFTFRSALFSHNELGTSCSDYGYRQIPPPSELWTTQPWDQNSAWDTPRQNRYGSSYLSHLPYPVLLRVVHVLGDVWSLWPSPRRHVAVSKDLSLPDYFGRDGWIGQHGPSITGNYKGGLMTGRFHLTFPDENGKKI